MVRTILCQFSGLPAPRFSRGKWLELFFNSSLVSLSPGSLEGSTWNYSSTVLWSLCPKVLQREVVGTVLHQFSGLPAPRFSRGKWLELFFPVLWSVCPKALERESGWNYSSSVLRSVCPKVLQREVVGTIHYQFSGLPVSRFSRGNGLELFFISSLVYMPQIPRFSRGKWLELFFITSLVCLSQGSHEGSGWNYSSSVLWSLCPKVLKREVLGTFLHQFSGLSVPRFSRGKWLELFFASSLVCLSQGSLEENGQNYSSSVLWSACSNFQGFLEGSGWNCSSSVLWSLCPKVLQREMVRTILHQFSGLHVPTSKVFQREVVGTVLHQFSGLSVPRFSRGNWLELFFISSLSIPRVSIGKWLELFFSTLWSVCPKVLQREEVGSILHQFSGLPAQRFSRGKWLELFFSVLWSVCPKVLQREVLGTILHHFSGLPVPRFCRGKCLELFFISSLVSLSQGSLEGSGWNYSSSVLWSLCPKVLQREVVGSILYQFSGLPAQRFSRGKWLELFFPVLWSVCLKVLQREGVGNILFQFYGLSVPRFSRGKWLELFFISSLVSLSQGSLEGNGQNYSSSVLSLSQGSLEGSGWNYFFQFYGLSVPRFSVEGSGWNHSFQFYGLSVPRRLQRDVVGANLHQLSYSNLHKVSGLS